MLLLNVSRIFYLKNAVGEDISMKCAKRCEMSKPVPRRMNFATHARVQRIKTVRILRLRHINSSRKKHI